MATNNKTLFAAILAGIGASACCIGPLLLLTLGISGSWIGTLTAMEPYSKYFTAFTIIMLAISFHKLYIAPKKCEEGMVCANPLVLKRQRIIFWIIAIILLAMVSFPYYADYFF
jgi:mercuric ion transport protein